MEERLARFRLKAGLAALEKKRRAAEKRERYLRGEHDLPFAPDGVNEEYVDLQRQAIAPYFGIAVNAPVQRLRAEGIRTSAGEAADKEIWQGAWKANKLDTRQTLTYRSMILHSRGIVSCWPNDRDRSRPIVRPESFELIHVEPDPEDPFSILWVLKAWKTTAPPRRQNGLILPESAAVDVEVAVLYDDDSFLRFEKRKEDGDWQTIIGGGHPMKRPPFALYDYKVDDLGRPWSTMDALIPQQDAINTIRFNTLLAMQFSAFRQRIITGFDPRAFDKDGNPLYEQNPDGTPKTDAQGRMIPVLNSPGRAGVDRILAFPGDATKVFDLPESNLGNYVEVLNAFLVQFFSTGQIPPQYLLNQMANLSGDALAGAESTLSSLVQELQLSAAAGHESLAELAWHAMGHEEPFAPGVETRWADAEARSFAQVIDAVVKLISTGFPRKDAWEMIPGTTPERLQQWIDDYEDEQMQQQIALAVRPLVDITGGQQGGAGGTPPGDNGQASIEAANAATAGASGA